MNVAYNGVSQLVCVGGAGSDDERTKSEDERDEFVPRTASWLSLSASPIAIVNAPQRRH